MELAIGTDGVIRKANENLTDKLKTSFTLTSALITAVAALGYFIAKETSSLWILLPIFFSLMLFVLSLVVGLKLFKPTTSFQYVDPMEIFNEYKDREDKHFQSFLHKWACTICDNTNKNVNLMNSKEKDLNIMYSLIVLGLALFSVSFLFFAFSLL